MFGIAAVAAGFGVGVEYFEPVVGVVEVLAGAAEAVDQKLAPAVVVPPVLGFLLVVLVAGPCP